MAPCRSGEALLSGHMADGPRLHPRRLALLSFHRPHHHPSQISPGGVERDLALDHPPQALLLPASSSQGTQRGGNLPSSPTPLTPTAELCFSTAALTFQTDWAPGSGPRSASQCSLEKTQDTTTQIPVVCRLLHLPPPPVPRLPAVDRGQDVVLTPISGPAHPLVTRTYLCLISECPLKFPLTHWDPSSLSS